MVETMTMIVTAYCSCVICCGPQGGITASGKIPKPGMVAMNKVKFGTKVIINGKTYVVEDRVKYDGVVDIYFTSHMEAKKFGKRKMNVWIKNE